MAQETKNIQLPGYEIIQIDCAVSPIGRAHYRLLSIELVYIRLGPLITFLDFPNAIRPNGYHSGSQTSHFAGFVKLQKIQWWTNLLKHPQYGGLKMPKSEFFKMNNHSIKCTKKYV